MPEPTSPRFDDLVRRLNGAMEASGAENPTERIKNELVDIVRDGTLELPDSFRSAREDGYARRLIHHDPQHGYTVVAMSWGPGQKTALHDHAGMWCVECVIEGAIEVTQYDLVQRETDRMRFSAQKTVRAEVGDAGCLIPPFEYHVLGNAVPDRTSISLHVYEGEMCECNLYTPADGNWWVGEPRQLGYDNS